MTIPPDYDRRVPHSPISSTKRPTHKSPYQSIAKGALQKGFSPLEADAIRKRFNELSGKSYAEKVESLIHARSRDTYSSINSIEGNEFVSKFIEEALKAHLAKPPIKYIFLATLSGDKVTSSVDLTKSDIIFHREKKVFIAPMKFKEKLQDEAFKKSFVEKHQIDLNAFTAHYVQDETWDILANFLADVHAIQREALLLENREVSSKEETRAEKKEAKSAEKQRGNFNEQQVEEEERKTALRGERQTNRKRILQQEHAAETKDEEAREKKKEEFLEYKDEKWEKYWEKQDKRKQEELKQDNLKKENS